jgi:hypothetical protein
MTEYIKINELIERDLPKSKNQKTKIYQLQAEKNDTTCNIVSMGEHSDVPVNQILAMKRGKFRFYLLSVTVTEEELLNDEHLKLICFVIKRCGKTIGLLSFMFEPDEKILNHTTDKIKGKYKIILSKKELGLYKKDIIRTYTEYPGREESIYLLTSVITEDNVIEKIVKRK